MTPYRTQERRTVHGPFTLLLTLATACAGGDAAGAPAAARVPERAGEVWELDRADDRAAVPAALLAYASGLHVVVIDDDAVYTGTTRLGTERRGDTLALTLPNGLAAHLVADGDALTLRFASGETIPLRRRAVPEVASR